MTVFEKKKENEQRKAELEKTAKSLDERLEAETNRLKEILKRENEERQREMRDLEAFSKKENAERKAETENINKILNAENDKRMKEAQALKDKMEKEKKELQAYLEQVPNQESIHRARRGPCLGENLYCCVFLEPNFLCFAVKF